MKTALLAALLLSAPAAAQRPDWAHPQQVQIAMTDHGFIPRRVLLKGGAPTVMRFVNQSGRTHNFAARDFFGASELTPRYGRMIAGGDLNVPPGAAVTLRLVTPRTPGAGYSFKSTHIEDAGSDMTGNLFIKP